MSEDLKEQAARYINECTDVYVSLVGDRVVTKVVGVEFAAQCIHDTYQARIEALRVALTLSEDVLSRFPYSAELWPNGMHPNAGITQIRAALDLS